MFADNLADGAIVGFAVDARYDEITFAGWSKSPENVRRFTMPFLGWATVVMASQGGVARTRLVPVGLLEGDPVTAADLAEREDLDGGSVTVEALEEAE